MSKLVKKQFKDVLPRETYYGGDNIIEQGDEGIRAYYIEKGKVEVLIREEGHELKVAELGPGDTFGEMALLNHQLRSATVRVLEECTVTVISKSEIERRLESIDDPDIRKLITALAGRLQSATKGQMEQYKNLNEFQDRMAGMADRAKLGIDESKKEQFREEIEPILNQMQNVFDKYQTE